MEEARLPLIESNNQTNFSDDEKGDARKVVEEFMSGTSAHGLPRIFDDRGILFKLFWIAVFVTALTVTIFQIQLLVVQFLQRNVNVRIIVVASQGLPFPSVSICNTNKLRKSAIADSPYKDILEVDTDIVRPYFDVHGCLLGDFQCNNTGCIKSYLKCDGFDNCRDLSDEQGCEYGNCGSDQFKCDTGSDMGICINSAFQCDRHIQCYGGEDEDDCECEEGMYECDGGGCIPESFICDGIVDCISGDDESCNGTAGDWFTCDGNRTIPPNSVCDHFNDCTDSTDEDIALCSRFTCDKSGKEVSTSFLCNNVVDCDDASDEEGCPDDRVAYYQPSADDMLNMYPEISKNRSLCVDFVDNYYHDHMLGRVVSEDPADWHGFFAYSTSPDYSDLENVVKLTEDDISKYGHQLNDFILECTFDESACNMTSDIVEFHDDKYGNCFQFNPTTGNGRIRFATKTGARYGLKMTLFTEQDEYISVYGRDSGARVVIHPPHVPAIPWSEGITITPGKDTCIGIKETRIHRESQPYGNCTYITDFESIYGNYYTEKACEESCIQDRMVKLCGCVDTMLKNTFPRCKLLDREQDTCMQFIYYLAHKQLLDCDCDKPCTESWYEIDVSQSTWPSKTYLKHLLKQIHYTNAKTKNLHDFQGVSENLIRLEVFFSELNYEDISERPAITEENLLSAIGGTLGLYIGFSFITIVELMLLGFDLSRSGCGRIYREMYTYNLDRGSGPFHPKHHIFSIPPPPPPTMPP
ncbi:uncharacterized protein LOC144357001 [Saccoglossus kowalevskii]